jgi:hypothetical protein
MKRLWLVGLAVIAACSGESTDESTRSDGGGENGGTSGSSSSGTAGIAAGGANGAMGGTTPTSTGGVPITGGSSGADASGGLGGASSGTAGDAGNAGEGAAGGAGGGTGTCGDVTALAECDARDDCHSVFVDPNDCPCDAPGCCARFSFCADGDQAECDAMVTCRRAAPFCAGQYVISYEGTCYEGCVRSSECAP